MDHRFKYKQNTIKPSIFIDKILIMTQNLVNNSKI